MAGLSWGRSPGALQHEVVRRRPGVHLGPGSAVHHHSASKTRVNALMVLHRIREMGAV
jgi:hypothetical protein